MNEKYQCTYPCDLVLDRCSKWSELFRISYLFFLESDLSTESVKVIFRIFDTKISRYGIQVLDLAGTWSTRPFLLSNEYSMSAHSNEPVY